MRFRLELFVSDADTSIDFYVKGLGFRLVRRDTAYASLRRGDAELGLGPIAQLPHRGSGPGFTQGSVRAGKGGGVEIVFEVEDLQAAYDGVRRAGLEVVAPPTNRPWGLRDFRIVDPDGHYVRVTTSAAT